MIETSVRCDHGAPRCSARLVVAVPSSMTRAIAAELRRAGWADLRSGHFCPTHRQRRDWAKAEPPNGGR